MDLFSYDALLRLADIHAPVYQAAAPVPHIALDNLLNPTILDKASRFPGPEDAAWYRYDNPLEKKLATNRLKMLNPIYRDIFHELNSSEFITFLEKLSGISGLIPDPHLNGGGLHRIERGGKLDIHADYNYHPSTKLDRRLNVLIYLNHGWKEDYRGHFELWDANVSHAVKKYLPIFNRMVIFSVSDTAFHGHPDPLNCPDGEARKALAIYYYSNGRPEGERSAPHSTLYKARPGDPRDAEIEALRAKRAKGRLTN